MTARTTFADFQMTVDDLVAAGDRMAGRITLRGTHSGALAGLPPTGNSVEFSGMFVRRLENGQLVEG
jgi:predicted ester cyclase